MRGSIHVALCLMICFATTRVLLAAPTLHSAERFEGETFDEAKLRYWETLWENRIVFPIFTSALGRSRPLSKIDFSQVHEWEDYNSVLQVFDRLRDERFLFTSMNTNFPRRISWLFPDDGCYVRAAMMNQNLEKWGHRRPMKLFVFGVLKLKTKNALFGHVRWWYHVAPIILVNDELLILDPAVNLEKPMPLQSWLATFTKTPKLVRVSLCDPYTYVPFNICEGAPPYVEQDSLSDQERFLSKEWRRVKFLGRDPAKELGDFPPWLEGE